MNNELAVLQQRYRTALYSYFRITNLSEAFQDFMEDPQQPPAFRYSTSVGQPAIQRRLASLQEYIKSTPSDNAAAHAFLQYRLQETQALELFCKMHVDKEARTAQNLQQYREMQIALYGTVNPALFSGIVARLKYRADENKSLEGRALVAELQTMLTGASLYTPGQKNFEYYKQLFFDVFPALHMVLQNIPNKTVYPLETIVAIFRDALQAVGADKQDWEVRTTSHGANVVVAAHAKRIVVSEHWQPKNRLRFQQVVAHEVGSHVQRNMLRSQGAEVPLNLEEEGVAILLEQLLGSKFVHKRAMRYLALCIGMGTDGQPRDFASTYTCMVQAMKLIGNDDAQARQRAFYETVRVFRGGFPDIAGAVYIKDKIYLESNLQVWEILEDRLLAPKEFSRLFIAKSGIAKAGKKV